MTIEVTNIGSKELVNLEVKPILIVGRQVSLNKVIENSELSELNNKKQRLITELEKQVETAYRHYKTSKMSTAEILAEAMIGAIDIYASVFSSTTKRLKSYPDWANEALQIDTWEDVERLEKEVILYEKEDSFLRKVFLINKYKLSRIIQELEQTKAESKEFLKGIILEFIKKYLLLFSCLKI